MNQPHQHADGSEEMGHRCTAGQIAEQNRLAAESNLRCTADRRKRNRGSSLIGEQRRKTDRRAA